MKDIRIVLVVAFACLAACVEEDPEVGVVAQELSGVELRTFTCEREGTYYACNEDLGLSLGRACFLAGVRGSLGKVEIGIQAESGRWRLKTFSGQPLRITTVCMSGVTNLTAESTWKMGTPSVSLGASPGRQCFLTGLVSSLYSWAHSNDFARTWRDVYGNWYLGGYHDAAYAQASARCVDVDDDLGETTEVVAPGALEVVPIAEHHPGMACALTQIGGRFRGDFTSGVSLETSRIDDAWMMRLSDDKTISAACVR